MRIRDVAFSGLNWFWMTFLLLFQSLTVSGGVADQVSVEAELNKAVADWTVPRKIIKKRLLPAALKDPSYFENNDFKIYTKSGQLIEPSEQNLRQVRSKLSRYVIRKYSGCGQPMGRIMFNLNWSEGVYLHEAPDKSLFKQEIRALSQGCIQLEDPVGLTELFISKENILLNQKEIHQAINDRKHRKFILNKPVPVIISYFTCEVREGLFKSFPDIYNRDKGLAEALKF